MAALAAVLEVLLTAVLGLPAAVAVGAAVLAAVVQVLLTAVVGLVVVAVREVVDHGANS